MGRVKTMNAAPNFTPLPPPPGVGAAPGSAQAAFTAPPPQGENNPFINAAFLWNKAGGSKPENPYCAIHVRILGVREATVGNPQYKNRGGWFIDLELADKTKATARVNIGDVRHQRLYTKFGDRIVGQSIIIRLAHPGDGTKAPWVVE